MFRPTIIRFHRAWLLWIRSRTKAPPRLAPQHPTNPLRRIRQDSLEPGFESAIQGPLRLVLGRDFKEWIDAGLDGSLPEQIGAEPVDRANAGELEL